MIELATCLAAGGLGSGMPEGPVSAALWDGGLGRAQNLCPRTSIGVDGRGYLLVDTPAFYGQIVASGTIEGRVAVDDATAVSLRMETLRYQTVISAIPSSFTGYGFTTVGVTHRLGERGLGVVGQVVLPSAIGLYGHSWPVGADLGVAGVTGRGPWEGHGQVGLAASAGLSKGPTQARVGVPVTLGGSLRAGAAFAVALDAIGSFGATAPVDHLAAAPAVRFAAGDHWGLELGAAVPLAGRERGLAAVSLATSWRLD